MVKTADEPQSYSVSVKEFTNSNASFVRTYHNSLVRVFMLQLFDPLHATSLSLSPLKTSEDFWFFGI